MDIRSRYSVSKWGVEMIDATNRGVIDDTTDELPDMLITIYDSCDDTKKTWFVVWERLTDNVHIDKVTIIGE